MSPPFHRRVWAILVEIPRGRVTTYGDIATALGTPRAARAVARACAENPTPYMRSTGGGATGIPCHRVVMGDGRIGGFSGPGGVRGKSALLRREGVRVLGGRIVDFGARRFSYGCPPS